MVHWVIFIFTIRCIGFLLGIIRHIMGFLTRYFLYCLVDSTLIYFAILPTKEFVVPEESHGGIVFFLVGNSASFSMLIPLHFHLSMALFLCILSVRHIRLVFSTSRRLPICLVELFCLG